MKGYSVTEYGKGYRAGRKYARTKIEALNEQIRLMRARIDALERGADVLVEMVNESRGNPPWLERPPFRSLFTKAQREDARESAPDHFAQFPASPTQQP